MVATINTTYLMDSIMSSTTDLYTVNVSSGGVGNTSIAWTEGPENATSVIDHEDASLISSSRLMETMYLLIGSVALIANTIVVLVFLSAPRIRKKITNMYIINQSCIDIMVAISLLAYSGLTSDVPYSGTAGVIYCMFWQSRFLLWGFLNSSTYNLVLLSFERYCAIVHPIFWKVKVTSKLALITMALVWVFGPLWEGAGKVPTTHIVNGKCSLYTKWPNDAARTAYGINVFVGKLFVPLLLLCYAYGRIVWTLHIKMKVTAANQSTRLEKGKENTIKTLAIVAVCFLLCWGWNQIYFFMFNVGYPPDFTSDFYHFSVLAVFLNCCINPFIYAIKYQEFQMACRRLLFLYCPRCARGNEIKPGDEATVATASTHNGSSAMNTSRGQK